MISISLTAEDWHIADALNEIAARIENDDIMDVLYDDVTDKLNIQGANYKAVITKTE